MMTLFKDPFFSSLDRVFNDSYERLNNQKTKIEKNDEDYRLLIAVPGLSKSDIVLSIKESMLTISYEQPEKDTPIFTNSFKRGKLNPKPLFFFRVSLEDNLLFES